MGFWGIEVKPGKPYPYHSDNVQGKLHITQATLGLGSSTERCILQCFVGHKNPIFLCSLLPDKNESCPLNLEFENDELFAFSVIGPHSIHLSGYFEADDGYVVQDDYESDSSGEDIAETETGDSSEFDSEDDYEEDFIDNSDLEMYPPSTIPNSGVVIEEIVDDEKPPNGNGQLKRKKKNQSSDSEKHREYQQQIVVKSRGVPVLESEDDDGFPVSTTHKSNSNIQKPEAEAEQTEKKTTEKTKKKKRAKDGDHATGFKRNVENVDQDDHPERKKRKNKKKRKEQVKEGEAFESGKDTEINIPNEDEKRPEELKRSPNLSVSPVENDHDQKLSNKKGLDFDVDLVPGKNSVEGKKKKKTQESRGRTNVDETVSAVGNQELEEKQGEAKSSQVRTFPNGLIIEELAMGKPDGKRASPGKQVSVHYIGKLKNDGKFFDSNVGRAPFKFRLGIGQVIKGWDVGVNGMRIGDKRRLTIPPSMGYGAERAGKIPPNSWLVFDVELVDVR